MENVNQEAAPAPYEVFVGDNQPRSGVRFPPAPPWRRFDKATRDTRGSQHVVGPAEKEAINAALCLRRPLLVTGRPGTGKSSLAYAVAKELGLGEVLVWPITSRSTLQQGLYEYDGIARVQETARRQNATKEEAPEAARALAIERFLSLGPLGSALADSTEERPRVLLVDEIDKSDIDLPNDLLHVFEEGEFTIPELVRLSAGERQDVVEVPLYRETLTVKIEKGRVHCRAFPVVLLTSNGEREFPPAFLRRCLRIDLPKPDRDQLEKIIRQRLQIDPLTNPHAKKILDLFARLQDKEQRELATDQLLNAVHLVCAGNAPFDEDMISRIILRALSEGPS